MYTVTPLKKDCCSQITMTNIIKMKMFELLRVTKIIHTKTENAQMLL